jgi:hypothetical protein
MSSVLKSEVKIATAHDIGVRMDDLLEQAKSEVAQLAGAQTALNESAKAVAKLLTAVDADVDGGMYDLQTAQTAKLYVNRAVAVLENLARQTSNMVLAANGKVTAFEKSVQSVSTYQDAEKGRLKAVLATLAAPVEPPGDSPKAETSADVATRPGSSIKERRRAEEAAAVTAGAPKALLATAIKAPTKAASVTRAPKARATAVRKRRG